MMEWRSWLCPQTVSILVSGILIGVILYRSAHEQPIVIRNYIPLCTEGHAHE